MISGFVFFNLILSLQTVNTEIIGGGNRYVPQIPAYCLNRNLCEDALNYPTQQVNEIITKLQFSVTENIQSDFRDGNSEQFHFCKTSTETIIPIAAKDTSGKWYFVINRAQKPVQKYKVEVCVFDFVASDCNHDFAIFNPLLKATCAQKHMRMGMMAVDYRGDVIVIEVEVPSCCVCELTPKNKFKL